MTRPTSSNPKTKSTSNNAAVIMSFAVEKESQFGIYSLSVPTRHGSPPKKRLGYNPTQLVIPAWPSASGN
jgi:hypothetical protein